MRRNKKLTLGVLKRVSSLQALPVLFLKLLNPRVNRGSKALSTIEGGEMEPEVASIGPNVPPPKWGALSTQYLAGIVVMILIAVTGWALVGIKSSLPRLEGKEALCSAISAHGWRSYNKDLLDCG
jgi:hypothetical protein